MGFLSVILGLLVGGYLLGIGTARTVLRDRQSAYEDGAPEQLAQPALVLKPAFAPKPAFVRIPVRHR